VAVVLLLIFAAGCARTTAMVEGRKLIEQGRTEEPLAVWNAGSRRSRTDTELRNYYVRTRDLYVNQLLYEGEKARLLGRSEDAIAVFQRVLKLSAGNVRGKPGWRRSGPSKAARGGCTGAGDVR